MTLRTTTDPQAFNMNYGRNNPATPINPGEIDQMRKRLFDNISDLNANKYRLMPDEYHQLLNYHHYALTILDNRKIIQQAEMSNPYNRNFKVVNQPQSRIETVNPYEDSMTVVYQRDGRAKIVDPKNPDNKFKGEWTQQFDLNVYNPPCFLPPSSNVWKLPQK